MVRMSALQEPRLKNRTLAIRAVICQRGGESHVCAGKQLGQVNRYRSIWTVADMYIQGSFAFTCHVEEAETLDQAWYAVMSLRDDVEPDTPSAALTTLFPPS